MARQMLVVLKDDIDGSEAVESINFSVRGIGYEIDLSAKNTAAFDKALLKWIDAARRAPRGRPTRRPRSTVDAGAVRAWANSNGIQINARGRIPAAIIEQYHASS
jgi:hypothetical protein